MNKQEFIQNANQFVSESFLEAFQENVNKALSSGALDESELNYAAIKAIALITAESYANQKDKTLKNLRHFI